MEMGRRFNDIGNLEDPIMLSDGQIYERAAIIDHRNTINNWNNNHQADPPRHFTSPISMAEIGDNYLQPNVLENLPIVYRFRQAIQDLSPLKEILENPARLREEGQVVPYNPLPGIQESLDRFQNRLTTLRLQMQEQEGLFQMFSRQIREEWNDDERALLEDLDREDAAFDMEERLGGESEAHSETTSGVVETKTGNGGGRKTRKKKRKRRRKKKTKTKIKFRKRRKRKTKRRKRKTKRRKRK